MKALLLWTLLGLAPVTLLAQTKGTATAAAQGSKSGEAEAWAQKNLEGWPPKTIALGVELVRKYGNPSEVTPTRITWFHNGPWKRTTLFKEGAPHNFPKPHQDVLEQTVDYRVPVEKVGDLLKYKDRKSVV